MVDVVAAKMPEGLGLQLLQKGGDGFTFQRRGSAAGGLCARDVMREDDGWR